MMEKLLQMQTTLDQSPPMLKGSKNKIAYQENQKTQPKDTMHYSSNILQMVLLLDKLILANGLMPKVSLPMKFSKRPQQEVQ